MNTSLRLYPCTVDRWLLYHHGMCNEKDIPVQHVSGSCRIPWLRSPLWYRKMVRSVWRGGLSVNNRSSIGTG